MIKSDCVAMQKCLLLYQTGCALAVTTATTHLIPVKEEKQTLNLVFPS